MRAPAQLARAGMAGQAPSPPTSPLAPAAQVSRSPLWLKSRARYCGSILAPVALLWPASGSAQLPLVMGVQPGCVLVCRIAGPYRHCRPRWAQWGGLGPGLPYVDRRLHRFRGPGDSRSRPSHVRGRLGRHSVADRQHRAAAPASGTPGCARPPRLLQPGTTVVARPAMLGIRGPGPGTGSARVDLRWARQSRPRPPRPQCNGHAAVRYFTRPAALPPFLRQALADSDGARGAGSRGHRDQRSRYATSRTLAPPSRASTSMTASLEPRNHPGPRPLNPAAGVNAHTPP
jgi:hypothetical protein